MEEKANSVQPTESSVEESVETTETQETPDLAIRLRTTKDILSKYLVWFLLDVVLLVGFALSLALGMTWKNSTLQMIGFGGLAGLLAIAGGLGLPIFKPVKRVVALALQPLNYKRVDCPTCGHRPRISIRWFSYACQECSSEQILNLEDFDRPKRMVKSPRKCISCEAPIQLIGRPAWFTCPECKSRVDLETLPTQWY